MVVRPYVLEPVPLLCITKPILSSLVLYINISTEYFLVPRSMGFLLVLLRLYIHMLSMLGRHIVVYTNFYFTFMWPCILTNFFMIKQTRCTNFTHLFWCETLHVSESSSVYHQEFIHCTLSNVICHTGL